MNMYPTLAAWSALAVANYTEEVEHIYLVLVGMGG